MIHLSFLGEREHIDNNVQLHSSEEFPPFSFESTSEKIRLLDSDRPYPLLHWTMKGRSARILYEGIWSTGFAKERGKNLNVTDHLQGRYAISITDLEGFFQEQHIDPSPHIAQTAMGINSDNDKNPFYHFGGVCLLINPKIDHTYGGETNLVPKEPVRKILIAKIDGNIIQYGGQSPGEAVAAYRIAPREIEGVILTKEFQDGNILELLKQKYQQSQNGEIVDIFRLFEDEINLLNVFCIKTEDISPAIDYLRKMGAKARILEGEINDQLYTYQGEPDDTVRLGMKVLDRTRKIMELNDELHDPLLLAQAYHLTNFLNNHLSKELEKNAIQTYSDLFLYLVKKRSIPLYDSHGSVVWPK